MSRRIGVRIPVTMGMDLDSDASSAKGSRVNYNIRSVSDAGQVMNACYIIKGAGHAFDVPDPVTQNIKIRITRDDTTVATGFSMDVVFAAGLSYTLTFDWATLRADIEADLDASIGGFTVTTNFTSTAYYDITIAYNAGIGFPMSFIAGTGVSVITLLEPVSAGLTDPYYCIGAYDLLGKLFLFLTNKQSSTGVLVGNISGFTSPSTGLIDVTITAHGLSTGDYVMLTGVGGVGNVNNQIFWVERRSANVIRIACSPTGAYTSGGQAYSGVAGVSEIGVAQKDSQTENWGYIMLARSLKLSFDREHCIDIDGEFENNQYSLYYTDNNGKLRLFYYIGDFTDAGAFRYYGTYDRPQGLYYLNTFDQESSLVPSFSKDPVSFVSQDETGGALVAGNYRYAYRLLSDDTSSTEWTYLTNPINVFYADGTDYAKLLGDLSDKITTKINNLSVTFSEGLPSIFKYIQWAYVVYQDDSFSGGILPRSLLNSAETTYELHHNGSEAEEPIDTSTLVEQRASFDTAKNIRILDNRLVISNIRSFYNNIDLSDYIADVTATVEKRLFSGLTTDTGGGKPIGATSYVNMYQKAENVYNYVGYMQHETYEFYLAPEYYNGSIGQPQFAVAKLFEPESGTSFTDYRISSVFLAGNDVSVFVPYVNIVLPAGSKVIDGKTVSSFIKKFHIYRAERTRPTILANGIAVLGVEGELTTPWSGFAGDYYKITSLQNNNAGTAVAGEFPFAAGMSSADLPAGSPVNPLPYPSNGGTTDFVGLPQYAGMYFPDDILKYPAISDKSVTPKTSGDSIINHGLMDAVTQTWVVPTPPVPLLDYSVDLSGVITDLATPPQTVDVEEGYTARDTITIFTGTPKTWSRQLKAVTHNISGALNTYYDVNPSCVVKVDADLDPIDVATDYGIRWVYYKRDVAVQYDRLTDQLIPTGAQVTISEIAPSATDVFGGDVFTQECYLQWRTLEVSPSNPDGFGAGIRFFSQNSHNWQMRNDNNGANPYQYPVMPSGSTSVHNWLTQGRHQLYYQNGYDIRNQINTLRPFDPNLNYNEDLRATFFYSELKPQGSKVDNYRIFKPLNRKSLESKYGEIIHHEVINGELFSVQLRKFIRLFFNSTGVLSVQNAGDIAIGNGAVLSRNGITISSYGGRNKWGIAKGKSKGGNDVLYVPDVENRVIWRFGADGLVPISIMQKINSELEKQFKWVDGDSPVADNGMTACWNQQHKEYILTVRVRRNLNYDTWADFTNYSVGTVVLYPDTTLFNDFDLEGNRLFKALVSPNARVIPGTDDTVWQVIELDDTDYYNLFTVVYSELEDTFKTFITPHPRLYLPFSNTYLTQNPYSFGFFENNTGNYATWWNDGARRLEADGYYSPVMNYAPDDMKQMETIQIRSEVTPFHVEINTENRQTYMMVTDFFEADEEGYVAPIKNDSTVTAYNPSGLNNLDTDAMYGRTANPVKIFLQKGVFQKISNIILAIRMRFPTINK